ncbi:linear gramicidin synthase subunit C [Mycobacteroides abscessus subsp. bolletii]|nr:linear gramicidin synthase subunit C [Mycobacteroides abscessus subsp. bolletii]
MDEQYEIADVLPLTPLQQGLLFHSNLAPEGLEGSDDLYAVQLDVALSGPLDPKRLQDAVHSAIRRRPNVVAKFYEEFGEPVQLIPADPIGSAQMLNLLIGSQVVTAKIEVPPRDHRISQNHLYWVAELCAEARGKIGMTAHHGMHRVAEPELVDKTRHGDVELHRVEVDSGPVVFQRSRSACECGVEKQTFLYGGQRQYVDDLVLLVQLIDLLLAQLSGSDIGRGQSTAATADVRADAGQGLEPQLAHRGRPPQCPH